MAVPAATRDQEVHVVGVDVGTTNTKAVVVSLRPAVPSSTPGAVRCVARASAPTPRDADALVACVFGLTRELLDGSGLRPAAVGIASMAETGVPLDERDRPLTPLVTWDADRGTERADAIAHEYGADDLFAATGVRVSAKVPLVAWSTLRRSRADVWARMRRWAGVADLVCLALTGRLATDHTLAGRTMAYRLPGADRPLPEHFDPVLLGVAGLEPHQLPDVCLPSSVAGRTLPAVGGPSGLPAGTSVVVAGHDHQVGAHTAGARAPGDRVDSVGTAEAVMHVVQARPDTARVQRAGMSLVRTVGGAYDALLAGSSSAGSVFATWLRDQGLTGREAHLVERARGLPEGPTGILALPYLRGRQCPDPDPRATFRMLATGPDDSPERRLKALFEGLCLQTRWMLAAQAELMGSALDADRAVALLGGPAAACGLWREVKQRVLPVPLRVIEVGEPVAVGAAVVAGERAGLVERGSLPSAELTYDVRDPYRETFDRFVEHARVRSDTTEEPAAEPGGES